MRYRMAWTALLVVACATWAEVATAQTVEEIIEANISAAGGEAAITAVESIWRKGAISVETEWAGAFDGTVEATVIPSEGIYQVSETGAFTTKTGWDGVQGWEVGPAGPRKIEGPELALMAQRSYTNLFLGLRRFGPEEVTYELAPEESLDDIPHHVLKISHETFPTQHVYIDKATHHISLTTYTMDSPMGGTMAISAEAFDYEPIGDVVLFTTATLDIEGLFSSEVTFTETTMNVEVDRSLFKAPE